MHECMIIIKYTEWKLKTLCLCFAVKTKRADTREEARIRNRKNCNVKTFNVKCIWYVRCAIADSNLKPMNSVVVLKTFKVYFKLWFQWKKSGEKKAHHLDCEWKRVAVCSPFSINRNNSVFSYFDENEKNTNTSGFFPTHSKWFCRFFRFQHSFFSIILLILNKN